MFNSNAPHPVEYTGHESVPGIYPPLLFRAHATVPPPGARLLGTTNRVQASARREVERTVCRS